MKNLNFIILAAGKGVRMKSDIAKVLHPLCGKPLIKHVIDSVISLRNEKRIIIVVGYQADEVKSYLTNEYRELYSKDTLAFALQEQLNGSGHAVKCALPVLRNQEDDTVIMYGDTPLIRAKTIEKLIMEQEKNRNDMTVLTARIENPLGYGRIIYGKDGNISSIKEQLDLSEEEKKIDEINVGVYCVRTGLLFKYIGEIEENRLKKEYYLTDLVKIMADKGMRIGPVQVTDNIEITGINSIETLKETEKRLLCKKN